MASSGGIGGGSAQPNEHTFGDVSVKAGGTIEVGGEALDVGQAAGAATLFGAVSVEDLATIKGLLKLKEVETPDGPILVPDDDYQAVDHKGLAFAAGPLSTGDGKSPLDKDLSAWWKTNFGVDPYNANTTPSLFDKIGNSDGFAAGVAGVTGYFENPNDATLKGAVDGLAKAVGTETENIMEILFLVFRESIKETSEDKKYHLLKLQQFNKMGEQLSDYLREVGDVQRDVAEKSKGKDEPGKVTGRVEVKTFDLSGLGKDGQLKTTDVQRKNLPATGLSSVVKDIENQQEELRNKRQMTTTAFETADQKANQLYNMMSTVLKSFQEMRMGVVRNTL